MVGVVGRVHKDRRTTALEIRGGETSSSACFRLVQRARDGKANGRTL